MHRPRAFTLVEILIVVIIMAILAMVVVPKYLSASNEARESTVSSDTQTLRSQIEVYRLQHAGRGPHLGANGSPDTANMVARLMGKTNENGEIDGGTLGPYIKVWPENPFAGKSVAASVAFGASAAPPRDNTTGWYYSTDTCTLSANTTLGGTSLDPPASKAAAAAESPDSLDDVGPMTARQL